MSPTKPMLIAIVTIIFYLAFGLTLFHLPFTLMIAQIAALILGIFYLIQFIKSHSDKV